MLLLIKILSTYCVQQLYQLNHWHFIISEGWLLKTSLQHLHIYLSIRKLFDRKYTYKMVNFFILLLVTTWSNGMYNRYTIIKMVEFKIYCVQVPLYIIWNIIMCIAVQDRGFIEIKMNLKRKETIMADRSSISNITLRGIRITY